jgi:hypothetical protein
MATVGKARVRMSLRETPSFAVFPGQTVAVEGNNPTGKLLVVNKVYEVVLCFVDWFRELHCLDGLRLQSTKIFWRNKKHSQNLH